MDILIFMEISFSCFLKAGIKASMAFAASIAFDKLMMWSFFLLVLENTIGGCVKRFAHSTFNR
jgi:hypothetical protein